MDHETSLQTKILIGLSIILIFIVWFQHCHYTSKVQTLESKVMMIDCIKQCIQESK